MHRVLILVPALVRGRAAIVSTGLAPAQAAQASACAGPWLIQMTMEGRDVVEETLVKFDEDGSVVVQSPPVIPALPGPGETPLPASDGLGAWENTGERTCAFEFVRLLGSDDGVGIGTLNVRGTAEVNTIGDELTGSLTIVRGTGFGQTAAAASGAFSGTPLGGPLLWLTPTA